jgi:hypothetical protein
LVDCRGSKSITGGRQGVWEEDLCGYSMVSFRSFLPDFQIDFTKPSHACFRLSRSLFDLELIGKHRGVPGWAWKWRIAFVEAFKVVLVPVDSCVLCPPPPISTVSNPFLSLQLASFDAATDWDAFDAFGWARRWRIAFASFFLVG